MADADTSATFRELFAVREYNAIFVASFLSVLGDQMATIALTVVVYQRSGSPLLAAAAYSLVFLPWLVGGPLLSTLADRWPRRRVMIACDVASLGLIGAAAIPGLPLAALVALVAAAAFLGPLFEAARGALLPQILDDDRYVLATAANDISHQVGVLIGFAAGGSLVALTSPEGAFALDALTFLVSALVVWRWVERRPVSRTEDEASGQSLWHETLEGIRVVAGHRRVRGLLLLVWVVCMYAVVPEALAVAYAAERGLGPASVGLLMGAVAAGVVVGNLAITRLFRPSRRLRIMGPLCLFGTVPLVLAATSPGLPSSLAIFTLVGLGSAGLLPARAAVMTAVPDEFRGRVFGVAATGVNVAQLVAVIGAGAAAQALAPSTVIALTGILGFVAIAALMVTPGSGLPRRDRRGQPRRGDDDAAAPSVPRPLNL